MTFSLTSTDHFLSVYLALAQYPILSTRIRQRMRAVLFERGIITSQEFESRVHEMAMVSQEREGLRNPYYEELADIWELRLGRIRSLLTDVIFSRHLTFKDLEDIIDEVLRERGISGPDLTVFNPELAPQDVVFEQAMMIESLPEAERTKYEARLQEYKVVLIRSLISDQLPYINIAKEWFTIADLAEIRRRKISSGRIGGKAAGMLLALRILKEYAGKVADFGLCSADSYYIGSDLFYTFMSVNNLMHWNDQKYKIEAEMRAEYPQIVIDFEAGVFPPEIEEKFQSLLLNTGNLPLICRSSSLLEDNFGISFAGKYESIFLPNQGTAQENLKALTRAIGRIYASTLNPNALLYRRSKGLQDYDERMAILIQVVQGDQVGDYYLPQVAGVAFSRNLYRWTPQIRREDGFIRLVWGLGTRAVERVGNDYPRVIALSHPLLRPSNDSKSIRRYSQQYVDVIDLQANEFKTLPIHDVLNAHYPVLRYLAQVDEDGYYSSLRTSLVSGDPRRLTLTFDDLLRRTPFAERMREILRILERSYRGPVDLEFTLRLEALDGGQPRLCLTLLQCRPQSQLQSTEQISMPSGLRREDIVLSTHFVVPRGFLKQIDYVVYVSPEGYFTLPTQNDRTELSRTVGRLNAALAEQKFICIGPGRWGSSNTDLGVPIAYGDIYHARALVEMSGKGVGPEPEPSLGTHFFQDLMEAQIYPLAVILDDPGTIFNRAFFYETPNRLQQWIPVDDRLQDCLRLIRVEDYRPAHCLQLVMNDDLNQAIAYLAPIENGEQESKS